MPEPFITLTEKGLYCTPGDFYLDPSSPVRDAVVTHAHSDHARPGHRNVHCTRTTAAFMRVKFRDRAAETFIQHDFHEPFVLNGVAVQLIPAGHLLGSAQVLMTHQGTRYLFTGDFKLQPDPTCEPYAFTEADVLITESTFAKPGFSHPDPESEIIKLNACQKKNIILAVYSLGKAQRIGRLISAHCPGKTVFLHPSIQPFHRIYENEGFAPGSWQPYTKRAFRNTRGGIYLLPPRNFTGYYHNWNYHLAFASGWDHLQSHGDIKMHISDHADWNDLLRVIDKTGAARVWTLHGDGRPLAAHLEPTRIAVQCLN